MAESSDNKKNMRDFLRIVFRNRLRFLLGSALVAIVVLQVAHYNWPLKYTGLTKFQKIAEAARRQNRCLGATAFQNRIGADSRAVDETLDFLQRHIQLFQTGGYAFALVASHGQRLGRAQ